MWKTACVIREDGAGLWTGTERKAGRVAAWVALDDLPLSTQNTAFFAGRQSPEVLRQ